MVNSSNDNCEHKSSNDGNVKAMKRGKVADSLTVCKDSMKMSKKLQIPSQNRARVVVHLRSPKILKASPEEFRAIVQQLTGNKASMLS